MTDIKAKRVLTKKRTELHFFDEVYRVYLVFMVCPPEEVLRFCKDHDLKDPDSLNFDGSSGYTIVFNKDTCGDGSELTLPWMRERHLPCLVHELAHLTMMTFDQKDLPIRVENQEAFAYYIEHWVKRITEVWEPKITSNKENKMSSNETKLEQEIQAKGLTAPRITPDELDAKIVDEKYYVFEGTTVTVCALVLQNGFVVVGESAAASPENFDEEIGRKIARDNARNKIWALEGYLLRERLSKKEAK